jgi:hypothetical protein
VWVDNKDYQRADHIGACKYLGIENPDLPHIEGLHLSCNFDFYQPTAIKAIHRDVLAVDVESAPRENTLSLQNSSTATNKTPGAPSY